MASGQELEVQQKRELTKKDEATIPHGSFCRTREITETEDALTVVMEMPGVEKDHTELTLEDGVLSVSGRIDFSKYENFQPIYTEYNIGYYRRSFSLSPSSIDEHKITADMKDGGAHTDPAKGRPGQTSKDPGQVTTTRPRVRSGLADPGNNADSPRSAFRRTPKNARAPQ